VLGHQFGENFVLGLDFLLQPRDAFLLGLATAAILGLESGGAVLKEFFLPAVENCRLKCQLVAELRDRLVVDQMPPQNGDLLLGGVVLSLLPHASSLR
jgi:hypothetical protein